MALWTAVLKAGCLAKKQAARWVKQRALQTADVTAVKKVVVLGKNSVE